MKQEKLYMELFGLVVLYYEFIKDGKKLIIDYATEYDITQAYEKNISQYAIALEREKEKRKSFYLI
jgi:hypothetical protein